MAVDRQGGTKYGMTINGHLAGTTTKYSKNIDYLNLQADSLASGYGDTDVFNFGQAVNASLMGGYLTTVTRKGEYELLEVV